MWFELNGWFWREPRASVVARLKRLVGDAGLPLNEQLSTQASVVANLEGVAIDVEVAKYTEEHIFFRMTSQRVTAGVHALFTSVFERLIDNQNPSVGELIWGWNAESLAPVLMHSHWRGEYPSPLSILEPETLTAKMLMPQSDEYWLEVGPRLHYIHRSTLARYSEPQYSKGALGSRLGREAIEMSDGLLFDCGWSLRWPEFLTKNILN